jgi:hypothetical protein
VTGRKPIRWTARAYRLGNFLRDTADWLVLTGCLLAIPVVASVVER